MACGYAKWTGRLGVCLATSGPGGIHLLNGLYDAKLDGAPVLAITGLQFHDLIGTYTQQDVELDKLFMDVAVYNARIMGPAHVRERRRARLPHGARLRGVAHVTMPVDIAVAAGQGRTAALGAQRAGHTSRSSWRSGAQLPGEDQVAQGGRRS